MGAGLDQHRPAGLDRVAYPSEVADRHPIDEQVGGPPEGDGGRGHVDVHRVTAPGSRIEAPESPALPDGHQLDRRHRAEVGVGARFDDPARVQRDPLPEEGLPATRAP